MVSTFSLSSSSSPTQQQQHDNQDDNIGMGEVSTRENKSFITLGYTLTRAYVEHERIPSHSDSTCGNIDPTCRNGFIPLVIKFLFIIPLVTKECFMSLIG